MKNQLLDLVAKTQGHSDLILITLFHDLLHIKYEGPES